VRVRLKGINRSVKRLADGTTKTFWYAWRGGPRLQGEPGTPEFIASYNAAVAAKVVPVPGTLQSVLTAYQSSASFTGLRDNTRKEYARYIAIIEKTFYDFPVSDLGDPRARGIFLRWRDGIASRSSADMAWGVLKRATSWALDYGLVPCNPFTKAGKLFRVTRADKIWTDEDEARYFASAPKHMHLPFLLAVWTGQRQGDLLRLPWSAYDGTYIRLTQSKTGQPVKIRVGAPLKAALDAAAKVRQGPIILVTSAGVPWKRKGFQSTWRRTVKRAGIKGLTFHDLRGTAVTRLAISGCHVPEIASVTGHSLASANAILAAHYLHLDQQLSESAIRKLETRTKLQTELQTASVPVTLEQEKK
jgi:integrase